MKTSIGGVTRREWGGLGSGRRGIRCSLAAVRALWGSVARPEDAIAASGR